MAWQSPIATSKITHVVELTPPGRAAVAVILVAGPDAVQAVSKFFTPRNGRCVGEIPAGQIVLGRWGSETGEELIFCRRGSEQIEIHCHGGAAAVHCVTSDLTQAGCERLAWQEWFRSSSGDPICSAARIALADAATERTAAILVDQMNGALAEAIREMLNRILADNWNIAGEKIDELLGRQDLGRHLTKPWRVVVCGPPNVGKSSLLNALAGYERAIVSPAPGTTRDVVTVATAIDGWPVQLADTAGFRPTWDELESAGLALATAALSKADVVICVRDATNLNADPFGIAVKEGAPTLASDARTIHAINKIDLVPKSAWCELPARLARWQPEIRDAKYISALSGEGIGELVSAISISLVPDPPSAMSAVPFTDDQFARLVAARRSIEQRDAPAAIDSLQALLSGSAVVK